MQNKYEIQFNLFSGTDMEEVWDTMPGVVRFNTYDKAYDMREDLAKKFPLEFRIVTVGIK